jgi:hypothetical protein
MLSGIDGFSRNTGSQRNCLFLQGDLSVEQAKCKRVPAARL